jgi:disulfide bond formation protein DsbB
MNKTMYHRKKYTDSDMSRLAKISQSGAYWLALASFGLLLETSALIYQYVLDYEPCVVCIHVRIGVFAIILLALAGFMLRRQTILNSVLHVLVAISAGVLVERSWQLLGTERGFIIGSCDFDLGMPQWLALDSWLPAVFEVQTSCGYTPEIVFGITMAEALLLISTLLLFTSISMAGACLMHHRKH